MTALRRRMIEDMRLAGLCEGTQRTYQYAVALLAKFYKRSPEVLTEEHVAAYFETCWCAGRWRAARSSRLALPFIPVREHAGREWALLKKRYARPTKASARGPRSRCCSPSAAPDRHPVTVCAWR